MWRGQEECSLNKRTIAILSIVAIVLFVVGFVIAGAATAATLSQCQANADGTVPASCGASAAGGLGIALLVYLLGAVAAVIAWIMGLVKTAQIGRWGWFVAVLLISPLGSLIYGLAGPTERGA
jgi:hypothetical protein